MKDKLITFYGRNGTFVFLASEIVAMTNVEGKTTNVFTKGGGEYPDSVRKLIENAIALWEREDVGSKEFKAVAKGVVNGAADTADKALLSPAAYGASRAAACAASYAADAAYYAARAADANGDDTAKQLVYIDFKNKLIELLKESNKSKKGIEK